MVAQEDSFCSSCNKILALCRDIYVNIYLFTLKSKNNPIILFLVEGLHLSEWFQLFNLKDTAEKETVIYVFP